MRVSTPVSETTATFRERILPPVLVLAMVLLAPLQFPNLLRAVEAGYFLRAPALIIPLRRLLDLSSSLVVLAAAWSIGSLFSVGKTHRPPEAGLEKTLDAVIIGLLVLSLATFGVALAGFFVPASFGVLVLVVVLRFRALWEAIRGCWRDLLAYWRVEAQYLGWPITAAVWISLSVIGFLVLVSHLYPTTETDAVNYHLFPVRTYVESHSWQSLPDNPNFYPEAMEMLYSLAYTHGSQFGARGVHLLFVPLLYALMIVAIHRFKFKPVATPALAMFLSVPIVSYVVSDSLTNDLPVAFFLFFALITLLRWREEPRGSLLTLAAVSLALALGSKHTAILSIPFFFLFFLVWGGETRQVRFKNGARVLGLSLFLAMAWYGKAFFQTGNPLWPTFSRWFSGVYNEFGVELLAATKANYGIWDMNEWYRIPGEMFFGDGIRLDGTLGLFPLLFLIVLVVGGARSGITKPLYLFLAAGFLSWLFVVQEVRYLIFLLPPLLVLGLTSLGDVIDSNTSRVRGWLLKVFVGLGILFLLLSLPLFQNIAHDPQRYTPLIHRRFLEPMMLRESSIPIRIQFAPIDDEYLQRMLPSYRTVEHIRKHLPDSATIFFMGAEAPYLYLNRLMLWDQRSMSLRGLRSATSPEQYLSLLRREGVTHIVLRRSDFPDHWLGDTDGQSVRKHLRIESLCNDYALYRILETPVVELPDQERISLLGRLEGGPDLISIQGEILGKHQARFLGDTRRAMVLLAESSVEFALKIPEKAGLSFAAAKLLPGIGDGGTLRVEIVKEDASLVLVELMLNPRDRTGDRAWREIALDLTPYGGAHVRIRFVSDPGKGGNADGDWFAVAEPHVATSDRLLPSCVPLTTLDFR